VFHILATIDHPPPSRPRVYAAKDQIQFAGGQQCFETVQKTWQGTVSVHLTQGQPGQQLAHAARLFGADTP
jgi:hypothetical protein